MVSLHVFLNQFHKLLPFLRGQLNSLGSWTQKILTLGCAGVMTFDLTGVLTLSFYPFLQVTIALLGRQLYMSGCQVIVEFRKLFWFRNVLHLITVLDLHLITVLDLLLFALGGRLVFGQLRVVLSHCKPQFEGLGPIGRDLNWRSYSIVQSFQQTW